MTKCPDKNCNGTIDDGFCNQCGTAFDENTGTVAVEHSPVDTGNAQTARTVNEKLGNYRGSGISALSKTTRAKKEATSQMGSTTSAMMGSKGSHTSRRTSSTRASSRRQMGMGLVEVPELPPIDPSTMIMANPKVPESKRYCGKCEEAVGRKTPKCINSKCRHPLNGEDKCPLCGKENGKEKGYCPKCGLPFNFCPKLQAGDIVADQYEVLGPLAYGGLGWIYVGKDKQLSRWVVLKGLLNTEDKDAMAAALAERRFLAAVKHSNIVNVYNFVEHTGEGYIVMEYVSGKTLKTIRKERGPLPVTEAIAYIHRILGAFGYLHRQQLVYCDFKPDNVIQEGDDVKLIDLGAVRQIDDPNGAIYGTNGYTAPEAGEGPTIVTDLYTIARTLAILITNIPGYDDKKRYLHQLPTPEEQPIFAEHESLYRWLLKATRQDPDERFQNAEEMASQLAGILRETVALQSGKPRGAESLYFLGENGKEDPTNPTVALVPTLRINMMDPAAPKLLAALHGPNPSIDTEAVMVSFPESLEARLQLAYLKIFAGQYDAAEQLLAEIENEDPFQWKVAWLRGISTFHQGKPAEAAGIFNLVINDLPGELSPKLGLALAAEAAKQPKDAQRFYELVIKTDDRHSSAAFGLARCALANQKIDEALKAFDLVPGTSVFSKKAEIEKAQVCANLGTIEGYKQASEIITMLKLDQEESTKIVPDILETMLRQMENTGKEWTGETVFGVTANKLGMRTGLEKAYRQLAVYAENDDDKIGFNELANQIRPFTLF